MKTPTTYKVSFWSIEHQTRGAYVGWGYTSAGNYQPRFRWSISYNHNDVWKSYNPFAARKEYDKLPTTFRVKCKIVEHKRA